MDLEKIKATVLKAVDSVAKSLGVELRVDIMHFETSTIKKFRRIGPRPVKIFFGLNHLFSFQYS